MEEVVIIKHVNHKMFLNGQGPKINSTSITSWPSGVSLSVFTQVASQWQFFFRFKESSNCLDQIGLELFTSIT